MLVGDGWAFVHISKCAGTTVRSVLTGREVSEVLPDAARPSSRHPFHLVGRDRPPGRVFTFIRHPVGWMRSYRAMRLREARLEPRKELDRLWSDDADEWAIRVVETIPGHIGRLFSAYAEYCTEVHRLEDGVASVLADILGKEVQVPCRNRARHCVEFAPATVTAILESERDLLEQYYT